MTPIPLRNSGISGRRITEGELQSMWETLLRGETIYIEYTTPVYQDHHRKGSIGKMVFSPREDSPKFLDYTNPIQWTTDRDQFVEDFYLGKVDINTLRRKWGPRGMLPLPHFLLTFDGRRNKLKPPIDGMSWLKDYAGPTKWVDTTPPKKKLPPKIVKDRLGRELSVGDFVSYILYHHTVSGAGIYFGTITKITDAGGVWAKNINLGVKNPYGIPEVAEKQIKDPSQIVIMTKDLMDQLVLAKLSS